MMNFLGVAHFKVMSHYLDFDPIFPEVPRFIFLEFLVQVDNDLKRTSAKFWFGEYIISCENCRNTV
jgi:hypothetical protein